MQRINKYLSLTTNLKLIMKKMLMYLMVLTATFSFSACKKDAKCPFSDNAYRANQPEIDSLRNYLLLNNLTAGEHASGFFYNISTLGSGNNPTVCSTISARYQGFLLNASTPFDRTVGNDVAAFDLGRTIEGWRKGLKLLKPGGTITLYVPPSLGYGAVDAKDRDGNVVIPANSYLRFEVNLVSIR